MILGTTSPPRLADISTHTAILYLNDDVIVTPIVNSNSSNQKSGHVDLEFTSWFVRLPEVNADMPVDEEICRRMDYTRTNLRKTLDYNPDQQRVFLFQHEMQNSLSFVAGRSETHVVDANMQRLLALIADCCGNEQIKYHKMQMSQETIHLASSVSPEHC